MAKTVLIVEDNELNMKLFRDLIEASGYETVQTRNGMEAMDLARRHHPDLILMDAVMPGMDGPTMVAEARKDRPDLKILFMTPVRLLNTENAY